MISKHPLLQSIVYPAFTFVIVPGLLLTWLIGGIAVLPTRAAPTLQDTFQRAARETGVPAELLQAICYMEGRLNNHDGKPSIDDGYGCMHLMHNDRAHTLDRAAQLLRVDKDRLKQDLATNIRGGAAILRAYALERSPSHTLPTSLDEWADVIAQYSHATTQATMRMYVEQVYKLLNTGFRAQTEMGEDVVLKPQSVNPRFSQMQAMQAQAKLPTGCRTDRKAEYPGAINCILDPAKFDCERVKKGKPCNYESSNRPTSHPISHVVVHDIEGTAISALHVFQDAKYEASAHYIIDTDGTIYQVMRERDIGYQAGNYWYNQHSIGLEHAGYDEKGYLWYNATQYLASAKLTAYLIKKYDIALDHDHIISHGAIPSPMLSTGPNHVDPGPYWLWPYYLQLIAQQDLSYPARKAQRGIITIVPWTGRLPFGAGGRETPANFNFFYLYKGPDTKSGRIPAILEGVGETNIANNIEAETSYVFTERRIDPTSRMLMYKIWFGVQDPKTKPKRFAQAREVWLAVRPGDAVEGRLIHTSNLVRLQAEKGKTVKISGTPLKGAKYHIGDAPVGARFVSTDIVKEDGKGQFWYEINYNHRQAWVPANSVVVDG